MAIDDGKADLIARIGLKPWRPHIPAIIGRISEDGAAARAGMQAGDKVLAIDGREIDAWGELVLAVRQAPGRSLPFEVQRGEAVLSFQVTPDEASESGERIGRIGVGVAEPAPGGVSMTASLKPCWRRTARSLASRATVVWAKAGYSASRSFHQSASEPCGSMSIRTTGPAPARCACTARCPDKVVFPEPPFCEANANTRKADPPLNSSARRTHAPHARNEIAAYP